MGVVLIVDDDPDIQLVIKAVAKHFKVISVASAFSVEDAKKAIDMLDDIEYITLDWVLPDGTGKDVIEHLEARGLKIPVVIFSADWEGTTYAKKHYPSILTLDKTQINALLNFIELRDSSCLGAVGEVTN